MTTFGPRSGVAGARPHAAATTAAATAATARPAWPMANRGLLIRLSTIRAAEGCIP